MPKGYFETENLQALATVFAEAKRKLSERQMHHDPVLLDAIAKKILISASAGVPHWVILREVADAIETSGGQQPSSFGFVLAR